MSESCAYFYFNLIVTGVGEQKHLEKLFKSLHATKICSFKIVKRIGQLSPITSHTRRLRMVGKGQSIPTKDEELGLSARGYLQKDACHFVILIDDLEYSRRTQAQQVFDRYRKAFDTILTEEQRGRAAVHFLVNMLEAYYFADAQAINAALGLNPPLVDYAGDVETIRHPKNELKRLYPGFDEVSDGGKILDQLNVPHVLSRPKTCAWLRTLFAWCVNALEQYTDQEYKELLRLPKYRLDDGVLSEITQGQIT